MRYNEKELQALSRQPAEMAAELGMRGPKKGSAPRSPVAGALQSGPGRTGRLLHQLRRRPQQEISL
ncbi:pleckstrin homology domain containing, family J member 1, isoform CRA_b [Mus musculus]|uniref:Pleckstrin homology domain containing, family J member 1 n=1 Tax=Mus musculus TaxID=10090 RepID=A0A1W2P6G2_MOUSE|nr:pleckstrin homology domain containing, family J member 1, isoform CRA_b [Mus musculus]